MSELRVFRFTNVGLTALSADIDADDTAITVANGSKLPALSFGQIATLVLRDDENEKFEIMNMTARSGGNLTVERGAEGTTAEAWLSGTVVQNSMTAAYLEKLRDFPRDPLFAFVVLLLQIDDEGNLSENSLAVPNITIVGDGEVSSEQTLFGNPMFDNPGTVDQGLHYLSAIAAPGTYQFSGEFTFEGWFYIDSQTNTFNDLFSNDIGYAGAAFFSLFYATNFGINAIAPSGSSPQLVTDTAPTTLGQLFHYAVTRDASNTLRFFYNGVQIGPDREDYNVTLGAAGATELRIGAGNSTAPDNGDSDFHWGEVRVTKKCRYTTDFTPPDGPFGAS